MNYAWKLMSFIVAFSKQYVFTVGSFVLFLYPANNFITLGSGNEEGTRTEQDQQVSSSEAGEANTQATQQPSSDPSSASGSENQSRRSIE
jgi:hypothetical protein